MQTVQAAASVFPRWVTTITGQAVVNIAGASPVFVVHDHAIMSVAINATEDRVVRRVCVAVIAGLPLAGVCSRVYGELMAQPRARPRGGRVTGLACRWKSRGNVVRVGDARECRRVTRVACRGCSRELVADVTIQTLH